jgi:hypothetical protein
MIRFLRTWLVPLLAGLMVIGIAISFFPLTNQAQARAESELTLLMDRAFAHIGESAKQAVPVVSAEEENLLDKAVAVARFLEHDDALLATDALKALCEQLSIDRIDVANIEGTLIASSEADRINTQLGTEEAYAWTMAAADNAAAALTQADATDPSTLYACVGRTDIDGFILLAREDPYVASALEKSGVEAQTADLPSGGDVLFQAQSVGEDGFFRDSGNLCLRTTKDDVTLIAARPLSEVFAVRNAALLAFGVALTCLLICGIAAYLLSLEPVVAADEEDSPLNDVIEPVGLLNSESDEAGKHISKQERRRRAKYAEEEFAAEEYADVESQESTHLETIELSEQHEQSEENAPRQAGRNLRQKPHMKTGDDPEETAEGSFEKIVE